MAHAITSNGLVAINSCNSQKRGQPLEEQSDCSNCGQEVDAFELSNCPCGEQHRQDTGGGFQQSLDDHQQIP